MQVDTGFEEKWKYIRKWLRHISALGPSFIVTRSKNCNVVCYKLEKAAKEGVKWTAFWVNLEDCRAAGEEPGPVKDRFIEPVGALESRLAFGLHVAAEERGGRYARITLRNLPSKPLLLDVETAQCFVPHWTSRPDDVPPMPLSRVHICHDDVAVVTASRIREVVLYGRSAKEFVRVGREELSEVVTP